MSRDPFAITLKTAVNTRAPLSERVPRRRPTDEVVPATTALHRGIHTTYDRAYGSVVARTDGSNGNHYLTLLRLQRSASPTAAPADFTFAPAPAAIPGDGTEQKMVSQRAHKSGSVEPVSTRHMPRDWETEQQVSSREVRPVASHDFYSTARKIERIDDDHRSGLVGNTQRTVDIMRKRATNPLLCPSTDVYRTYRPTRPQRETDASGRPDRYCLDIVDCTHLMPKTEHHLGFDVDPIVRLPDGETLSQAVSTQQRVITRMATSHPLFGGTAKVKETTLPHYGGHVPMHPHNVSMQRGLDTDPVRLWSKSHMTLATHGGGIDTRYSCNNPLVRSRSGARARAPSMIKPKKDETIRLTVEGSMLQDAFTRSLPAERAMNRRVYKKR